MWKKLDGELPPNHEVRTAGAHLYLHNVQFEDSGTYQCEAVNSKGKDYHTALLSVEGEKNVHERAKIRRVQSYDVILKWMIKI